MDDPHIFHAGLSPVEKRGYTQGISTTVMSFPMAVSPWLYGELSDRIGTNPTLWTAVGASVFAALVNVPLMFAPALKNIERLTTSKIKSWLSGLSMANGYRCHFSCN